MISANAFEPKIENAMTAITRDLFVFMQKFIDVFNRFLRRVRRILRYHRRTDRDSLLREVVRKQNRGQRLRLAAFRGENRFRIGAGNFAHRNPAEAADKRAD